MEKNPHNISKKIHYGFLHFAQAKSFAVYIGISAAAVVLFSALFITRYIKLSHTIENERFTYVDELQTQLLDFIDTERKTQMFLLRNLASVLSMTEPDTFSQLAPLSDFYREEGNDMFLLVSDDGMVYDLAGKIHALADLQIPLYLLNEKDEIYSYSVIDNTQEYWLCGIHTDTYMLRCDFHNRKRTCGESALLDWEQGFRDR